MFLQLEVRRSTIYLSTDRRELIQEAIDFLEREKKVMDENGSLQRTIFDFLYRKDQDHELRRAPRSPR